MRNIFLSSILFIFVLLIGCDTLNPPANTSNNNNSVNNDNNNNNNNFNLTYLLSAEAEAAWIMSAQIDNGAVLLHPNGTGVMPYFSNMALQAVLMVTREFDADVKEYLEWYMGNINNPDNLGVSGTIYDFHYAGGTLTSLDDYDSSDSYAATFLSLMNEYLIKTNDQQFILDNLSTIELIASAIDATAQSDGLTYAKANYHVKYLMDNVEVWRGYVDFAALLHTIGNTQESAYLTKASQIRVAIEEQMWDGVNQEYYYYAGDSATNWAVFYPDATANLWPTIFGFSTNESQNQLIFQKFITAQPSWETLETGEFAWASVRVAAVKVGENNLLGNYDRNLTQKFLATKSYPCTLLIRVGA